MSLTRVFGNALAWLVGKKLGVRRRHAITCLRRAGIADPEAVADGMYRSLGSGVFELCFHASRRANLDRMVSVDTRAFDDLLAAGRGAVVAAAHTGNWDLVLCAAGSKTALTVVTKRQSVRWINWLWQKLRACHGVRLVEKGRAAREALRALGRGEAVAMMIDQAPDRRRGAIQVPFLGQLAWVDLSPALIALRARAPLIAAFPHRCADDIHRVEIGAVLWPSRFPSREWAEQAMRRLTADLEAFVVAHPEQWLWMHRRWKDPPEAGRAQRVSRPK